jgi:hypothetical protein
MAACVAAAFISDANSETIVEVALRYAKEGTRNAIAAVIDCAGRYDHWQDCIGPFREVIRPHDGAAEVNAKICTGTNNWHPSREHSIEELPIALGFLVVSGGDFEASIIGSANYGRDNDSIAGMAGAIAGALLGISTIRPEWIDRIRIANRIDLEPLVGGLATLTVELQRKQFIAVQERQNNFTDLLSE